MVRVAGLRADQVRQAQAGLQASKLWEMRVIEDIWRQGMQYFSLAGGLGWEKILALALITAWVTLRLRRLPIGRAWEALREDEIACRSLGINPTNTKLTAFGIGAMFAGFAGSFDQAVPQDQRIP